MISDLTKAGLTAATAGVSSQLIVMAQEYNGKADAVEAVSKALPPVAVIVALAVCMLAFPPAVLAQPQSVGELLVGKAAFGDWRTDAPMVRRKITDLPAPYATRSASNPPRVIGKPISATPQVPPGFQVELFASNLHDPRTIRVAPNGDIFIAESEPGRIRVIRAADGAAKPSSNDVFASGLDQPFGIAFYPPGSDPQWIYVANTGSVVRFPYRSGDLKARGKAEVIVRDLPHAKGRSVQRGHITRDIVFSQDGQQMFVSVGSASNDGEGMEKRNAGAIVRWEADHGLGSAWGNETDRAAVLVFNPDGGNRRVFASGLRNCVGTDRAPANRRPLVLDERARRARRRPRPRLHYARACRRVLRLALVLSGR